VDDLVPFDGRTLNPGGAGAHARDEEKKDAGVNYPWLTAYERRARGIDVDAADGELLEKFRGCRKDDGGGFWQLESGMEPTPAVTPCGGGRAWGGGGRARGAGGVS